MCSSVWARVASPGSWSKQGPIVAAAFLQADLVDEALLLRSPNSIGADGIDALEGLPLEALTRSSRLTSAGQEEVGADTIEHFLRS